MKKGEVIRIKQRPITVAHIDQKMASVSISVGDNSQITKKQSYKKAVTGKNIEGKNMRQSNESLDLTSSSNVKHLKDIKKSKLVIARENSTEIGLNGARIKLETNKAENTNRKPRNIKNAKGKYLTLTGVMLDRLNIVSSCELMLEILEDELHVDIRDGASLEDISERLRKFCRTNSSVGYYDINNTFNGIVLIWFNYIQSLSIEIKADKNMEKGIWRHHISSVLSVLE